MSKSFTKITMENGVITYIYMTPDGEIYKGETVEKLKENYRNGDGKMNSRLFNQFTANPPPVTIPHFSSLNERNARRERYEENEGGSDLHFVGERRRATSHKFGGDSKRMSRRSSKPQYRTKANYGNYDDEELERKRYRRGNDYSIYFDADDTEDKGIRATKEVSDNKARVNPVKTYPYENDVKSKAPPVTNAKHRKIRRLREDELTDTAPDIRGVDDAAGYMYN